MTQVQSSQTACAIEQELAVEQAHVDRVYARLGEATRSAQQVATAGRCLFHSDRGSYVREEDGTGLYERDVFAFQAAKRLAVLDAEHEGLVFGRLDRTDGEIRYVGRIGVRDADYEPLVIDWRAPAAEPFYRATPTNPMQVVRRRVLRCHGDRVVGIEDDLLDGERGDSELVVIGEGALMAALSRARGHTMRDIVATIQAEQDEAIRAPHQGFTMISGGPGTGQDRRRPAPGGLPALLQPASLRVGRGAGGRPEPGLHELHRAGAALPRRGVGDPSLDRRGRLRRGPDHRRPGRRRRPPLRSRAACGWLGSCVGWSAEPLSAQPMELRVIVKGEVLVLPLRGSGPDPQRRAEPPQAQPGREAAEKALLNALWRIRPHRLDLERDEFDDLVTDLAAFEMFLHAWWPAVSCAGRAGSARRPGSACAGCPARLLTAQECELLGAELSPFGEPVAPIELGTGRVADGALLDELVDLLGPVPDEDDREVSLFLDEDSEVTEVVTTADRMSPAREVDPFELPHQTYAHILVDEAQDITPMQWRMLRRRGASASWTIVGDPAQSSWPDTAEAQRAIDDMIGTAPVRRFRMSTNYRSPAEVFDLAARVVVAGLSRGRPAARGPLHRRRAPAAGGR